MKSKQLTVAVLVLLSLIILIIGILIGLNSEKTSGTSKLKSLFSNECEQLALELDNNIGKGRTGFEGVIVGGTLLEISEPEYFDYGGHYPAEYVYKITFKGKSKTASFKFHTPEKVTVPLSEGQFYRFELTKALGRALSMGPHNLMFSYNNLNSIFDPVAC